MNCYFFVPLPGISSGLYAFITYLVRISFASCSLYSDGKRTNLDRTWYELGTKEVGGRGEIGMDLDRKRLVISVLEMLKWANSGSFLDFSL